MFHDLLPSEQRTKHRHTCNETVMLARYLSKDRRQRPYFFFLLRYTLLPLDQPFESLFLPKFFNFLYLSTYVSDFSQHLLSHHFIPSSPQVTMKHDLKPAFYFLTSKTKTTYKQKKKKKKRGSFSNYFWTINKAYFSRGESFNLLLRTEKMA